MSLFAVRRDCEAGMCTCGVAHGVFSTYIYIKKTSDGLGRKEGESSKKGMHMTRIMRRCDKNSKKEEEPRSTEPEEVKRGLIRCAAVVEKAV